MLNYACNEKNEGKKLLLLQCWITKWRQVWNTNVNGNRIMFVYFICSKPIPSTSSYTNFDIIFAFASVWKKFRKMHIEMKSIVLLSLLHIHKIVSKNCLNHHFSFPDCLWLHFQFLRQSTFLFHSIRKIHIFNFCNDNLWINFVIAIKL